MKMKNKFLWLRHITALSLMIAVFAATSLVASAAPDKNVAMGELIVSGSSVDGSEPAVMLNGERAISGRTFFSSGTIATTETTSATVNLGKLGSVSLAPNSALTLHFGNGAISGTLTAGQINVANSEGVAVNIVNVEGASVTNAQQDDEGKVSRGSQTALVLVFVGIVAATAIYLYTRDRDNVGTTVSPVR